MPDPNPNPNPGNPGGGNPAGPQAVDWATHIPQELAAEKVWEPLKGKPLGDVLKSYVEAQKMVGREVHIPKEDAPVEEWSKFYQKIGMPETPDKYQIRTPAMAEGVGYSKELEKNFLAAAHKMGISNKQAQALIDFQASAVEGQLKQIAEGRQARVNAIKQEWGADFERRLGLAIRAKDIILERAGISKEDAASFFDEEGAGDNPVVIKIFHHLGELFAEDGWIKADSLPASGRQAALEKIAAIQKDPKHAFWNDGPGHKEAVEEMTKLHKQAYG